MNTHEPADIIRQCLKATGFDQRKLSDESGVSEVTLSRILNGHSDGSGKTIKKLLPFLPRAAPEEPASHPPEAA